MLQFATADNSHQQTTLEPTSVRTDLFVQAHAADNNRSILENAVHSVVGIAWHDEHSNVRQNIENGVAQFATAVPLFMGGARGYILSGALYGLNQAKVNDTGVHQLSDFALGAVKGVASKGTFDYLGSKENMNFAVKGVLMGSSSRAWDGLLTRETYLDGNGHTDVVGGLGRVGAASFNPIALGTDIAVFGAAHYGFKWADGKLGGKLSQSPALATAFTGSTFGFTSGALGEIQRERQNSESFSIGNVLTRAGEQSLIMGTASLAGLKLTAAAKLPQVVRTEKSQRTAWDATTERLSNIKTGVGEKLSNAKDVLRGNHLGTSLGSGDMPGPDGELHPAEVKQVPLATDAGTRAVDEHHGVSEPEVRSEFTAPEAKIDKLVPPTEFKLGEAVWHNGSYDQPVMVREYAGEHDGRHYVLADPIQSGADSAIIEPSNTGIPLDQLTYKEAPADSDQAQTADVEPAETGNFNIPKGRKPEFVQGTKLMFKALETGATARDVNAFFDWARGDGADLRAPMQLVAQQYGTQMARELARGAYEPITPIPTVPGYEDVILKGKELLTNLAVANPKQEDINAFLEFAKTPEAITSADGLKVIAATLARVTGIDEVLNRVDRAFAPAIEINYDGPPEYLEAWRQGFNLVDRLARSKGTDEEAVGQLSELAKGDGKYIEPQLLELVEKLCGKNVFDYVNNFMFHADDKPLWIIDKETGEANQSVWVSKSQYDDACALLGRANAAIAPGMDHDLARHSYENFENAARVAAPELRDAILEYAEKSGSDALLATVRDALAPDKPAAEISLTREQNSRFAQFEGLVRSRPVTDDDVRAYKEAIVSWLSAPENADLRTAVQQLGPSMTSSAQAEAVDQVLDTSFSLGFPLSRARISEIQRAMRRQGLSSESAAARVGAPASDKPVPGGKVMEMPVDDLITTMYNATEISRREQAGQAAQLRVRDMDSTQFMQYLQWLYSDVHVSDGNGGLVPRWNMDQIHLPGASVLHRADVLETLTGEDASNWKFTIDALHKFLSFTPTGAPEFPDVLREMEPEYFPNWMLSDINRRYILTEKDPANVIAKGISPELQARVAEDVANQTERNKQAEAAGKLKGKRPKGPPEALRAEMPAQRLTTLGTLLDSGLPPEAVTKLMEIGGQDGRLFGDLLKKIDLYKPNDEFRRSMEILLPRADNLYTIYAYVRAFEDTANLGFKSPEGAARSARLAKVLAETMLTPGSPEEQELITGPNVVDGKDKGSVIDRAERNQVRLPRPPKDFGGKPGAPQDGKGGRPGREPRVEAPPPPVVWNFAPKGVAEPAVSVDNEQPAEVTDDHSHQSAAEHDAAEPANFAELLVKHKVVSQEELETAEAIARTQRTPLADTLVNLGMMEADNSQEWLRYAQFVLDNGGVEPDSLAQQTVEEVAHHDDGTVKAEPVAQPGPAARVESSDPPVSEAAGDHQADLRSTAPAGDPEPNPVLAEHSQEAAGDGDQPIRIAETDDQSHLGLPQEQIVVPVTGAIDESGLGALRDEEVVDPAKDLVKVQSEIHVEEEPSEPVTPAREVHEFNTYDQAILDAVRSGKGRYAEVRDWVQSKRKFRIKQSMYDNQIKQLKKDGWVQQQPKSDAIQVTDQYNQLLRDRAAQEKAQKKI